MVTHLRAGSLAVHALLGALLLVAASAYVGFDGYVFIDEAALYGQLDVLDQQDGWTIPRPFPEADPDARHVPMANADVAGDRYAPFAKHPVHVVLARAADLLGGDVGVRLLSSAGLLVAALAAATIAGARRGVRLVAFWATLAASPLLFDANLVVAHTIGAAVTGVLFAVALRAPRRLATLILVAVLACLGGLLRNEVLLLAGSAAVAYAVVALRCRSRWHGAVAGASLGGALVAYLGEPLLVRWAIGGRPGLDQAPTATSAGRDVLAAAARSLFEVNGLSGTTLGMVAVVACATFVAVFALQCRRRAPDGGLATLAGGGALVGAVLFLTEAHLVTGLVWAFPALLVLLALVRSPVDAAADDRLLLGTAALFAVFVGATQYSQGGGLEWGWRYVAVAIPLVTPVVAHVVVQLWVRRPVPAVALVMVAVACVVVQLGGLRYQRGLVRDTAAFLDRVDVVAAEADADWVLSVDASFGRFAHQLSTRGSVATAVDGAEERILGQLADDGVTSVLLVWRFGDDVPLDDLQGYRVSGDPWYIASEYRAAVLLTRS